MITDPSSPFDFIADDLTLSIAFERIDFVFSSRVIGKLEEWLVIAKDPALETFEDQIQPGDRLVLRFLSEGRYCQVGVVLKRLLSDGTDALVIAQPGVVEQIERRREPRWRCDFSARMEVRHQADVVITNINTKGCRLRWTENPNDPPRLFEGDQVHLDATIPGFGATVPIIGEIRNLVATDDRREAGILFGAPVPELSTIIETLKKRPNKH